MKAYDRAAAFGVFSGVVAAVSVRFQFWMSATFWGLLAIHWFLLMAARIIRDGE